LLYPDDGVRRCGKYSHSNRLLLYLLCWMPTLFGLRVFRGNSAAACITDVGLVRVANFHSGYTRRPESDFRERIVVQCHLFCHSSPNVGSEILKRQLDRTELTDA
jgi:hypothetical protein